MTPGFQNRTEEVLYQQNYGQSVRESLCSALLPGEELQVVMPTTMNEFSGERAYSERDFFILGIRRSGNHAITNWLLPQFNGLNRFYNDIPLHGPLHEWEETAMTLRLVCHAHNYVSVRGRSYAVADPYHNRRILYPIRNYLYQMRRRLREHGFLRHAFWRAHYWKNIKKRLYLFRLHRNTQRLMLRHLEQNPTFFLDDPMCPVACNIFGLENRSPLEFAEGLPNWVREFYSPYLQKRFCYPTDERHILLLIRSPWNNLASILEHKRAIRPARFKDLWKAYAREFLGITSSLSALGKVTCISFDNWVDNPDYRKILSEKFKGTFSDYGVNVVDSKGGGSSFDGLDYHGRPQLMDINNRWRQFKNHPLMIDLMKDEEVMDMSQSIFGHIP